MLEVNSHHFHYDFCVLSMPTMEHSHTYCLDKRTVLTKETVIDKDEVVFGPVVVKGELTHCRGHQKRDFVIDTRLANLARDFTLHAAHALYNREPDCSVLPRTSLLLSSRT